MQRCLIIVSLLFLNPSYYPAKKERKKEKLILLSSLRRVDSLALECFGGVCLLHSSSSSFTISPGLKTPLHLLGVPQPDLYIYINNAVICDVYIYPSFELHAAANNNCLPLPLLPSSSQQSLKVVVTVKQFSYKWPLFPVQGLRSNNK